MFTVSYFFVRSYVSIVEFDRSPSSSLDASKLGRVQIPVGRDGGVNSMGVKNHYFSHAVPSTNSTHGYLVLSPVSLTSRDQNGGPSNSAIGICDLKEK